MLTHTLNRTHFCKTCALYDAQNNFCVLHQKRTIEHDFCSKHTTTLYHCDCCKKPFLEPAVINQEEKEIKILCPTCTERAHTCALCENNASCKFQDPSIEPNIPIMVMKSIQRGPAIMQTQIPNPERMKRVCVDCTCFDEEIGCAREYDTCRKNKSMI